MSTMFTFWFVIAQVAGVRWERRFALQDPARRMAALLVEFGYPAEVVQGLPARLSSAQADGLACVTCELDFTSAPGAGVASVPIGLAPDGVQVFACAACCGEAELPARSAS